MNMVPAQRRAHRPKVAALMPDRDRLVTRYPSWVVPLRSTGSKPTLFCCCGGDGDATVYRDLTSALPSDQPVYALGLPPLPPGAVFPTIAQLATDFVKVVRNAQAEGPYYLCGHSLGGVVAYEMAALLERAGAEVRLVALIDTLHPAFRRQMTRADRLRFRLTYVADRLAKYARKLGRGRLDQVLRDSMAAARGHTTQLYWRLARVVFGRLGHAPPGVISSNALVLTAAWHHYEPADHGLALVMFNAEERPAEFRRDHTLGWRANVSRSVEVHLVPGDHYTMLRRPHAYALAKCMASHLPTYAQSVPGPESTAA
jgi:thioesterase domain-containing protein